MCHEVKVFVGNDMLATLGKYLDKKWGSLMWRKYCYCKHCDNELPHKECKKMPVSSKLTGIRLKRDS